MAKKKNQPAKKNPSTSSVDTNLPMKGMIKDTHATYLDKKNWSHARNAINNSIDGDTGVIGNEPANLLCAEIPYTVIGGIHLYGDKWIIFSTDNEERNPANGNPVNDKASEIGEFDDSTCTYTTLINDTCLNFHKDNLIIGVSKENFDCSWQIYWDDGYNPSRTINLNDIPYLTYNSTPGEDCAIYVNFEPLQLDCEKIRLAPLLDTPTIKLTKANEGGQLPNGMYQVFVAYSINDQIIGDYLGQSNLQSLWSHENNGGSLDVKFSGIDKEFEFMQVVVRTRVHNGYVSYILGYYSTETTTLNIDYLDPDLEKVKSSRLLLRNPAYEKSSGMYEVNDYLIRSQPTEQFDFNYQPLANDIITEWVSASYPSNYYKDGGNKPTFLRDEVYTFFIRFFYNTGEKSKAYHIPGRAPVGNETDPYVGTNTWDGVAKNFKVINTASYTGALTGTLDDGGVLTAYGNMGYWEAASEKYPATDPERYNDTFAVGAPDLCGKPIRHHKMPDENTDVSTRLATNSTVTTPCVENCATHINILGAQFSNIAAPRYNDGTIIPNIAGYEILVGNRDGNKSIIAKGIIRNMMTYERYEHTRSLLEPGQSAGENSALDDTEGPREALANATSLATGSDIKWGLFANYPYNDTAFDPYLIHRGNGDASTTDSPWLASLFGGDPVESNWITGRGSLFGPTDDATIHMVDDNRALNEFTRDYHTFHSPDLNFTQMYLAPSEMVVYKTLTGRAEGNFKKSEDHPGAKLLKNKAVLIAAIIGVGYALNHMRGKRNVKINTARSQSSGETMAVGSGMTPMPGTGTAAAAVNVLLNIPGVVVGAIADIAFNTVVDVASVFGAGKLARQIGTPIYQMIETGTTGLMAGHIGPNKSIEYVGSDFTSTPTLFSMITGVLTFLNYVAIGGDKIIDLILKMVDYQDYAFKYNSHGFYSDYGPFAAGTCIGGQGLLPGECTSTYRHQINKARYIKQGIQYIDDVAVNNLHRPSTVVINTNTSVDTPGNWNNLDDSKFVIGGAQCAADGTNSTVSWWTPTGLVKSNIAAHYVGLKVDNDNQYGQLDSVLFTPMSQPFRFKDMTNDITTNTRFNTGPLFGGDTYISRYTEKVTMPFWFDFMKEGPDGMPFDYRYYSNIPFPRYWMNTEKYRMEEFVRPITNLSFKFDEAFPSDMYHLDQPTAIDCDLMGYNAFGDNSGGEVANYFEEANFHLQVVKIPSSSKIMATVFNYLDDKSWEINGVGKTQWISHPGETAAWYVAAGYTAPSSALEPARKREVAIGIQARHRSHQFDTPLINWEGDDCISSTSDHWLDLVRPEGDMHQPSIPKTFDFSGVVRTFKALYDWNAGEFLYPVANSVDTGVIGNPAYNTPAYPGFPGGSCNHNGECTIAGVISDTIKDKRSCTLGGGSWVDSCWPEDDPRDFIYYNEFYTVNESGWAGWVDFERGSLNVNGGGSDANGTSNPGSWTDCVGSGYKFCRPGSEDRANGLDPDGCYRNTNHYLLTKGGAPPRTSDIGSDRDNYSATVNDPGGPDDGVKRTGGLFIENLGYMYTHNSGIQDFFVESDMNLSFRDWEDVKRKKHYDHLGYTDYHELFHKDHISGDNFYKYDQSLNIRRFWTASFGNIQPRWYDPIVSETCFTKYPKRLLYSLPSVGVHTKSLKQFKNDERSDHWRTFLPENFRDFKSTVNTIVPTNQTGALILFPTLSPQLFQGTDQIEMAKSGNKLTIGDGGLFSQTFQQVSNSNVSHEYGSCESSRSVVQTPAGMFFVSQAQGKIFKYSGKGIEAISDLGMKWWFNKYLPSQLLKAFPEIEEHPRYVDNPVIGAGVQAIYDPNNDIVYFSKRDYKPLASKAADMSYQNGQFQYNDGWTVVPVDLTDTDYFEDISWTVSFDPKAKAWISFHDWHPELAFNSINHFLTTKKSISATPICPPGYTYNGVTDMCEISAVGSQPANLIDDIIVATNTSVSISASNSYTGAVQCEFDAVLCLDASNSVANNDNVDNMRAFGTGIVNSFSASLALGNTRMGFVRFGGGLQNGGGSFTGFNDNELQDLTSVEQELTDRINNTGPHAPGNGTVAGTGYHIGTGANTYDPGYTPDTPCGTDTVGGLWHALAILYGPNSRPGVPKKLFLAADGADGHCAGPGFDQTFNSNTDLPFGWTPADLDVVTPTVTLNEGGLGSWTIGSNEQWFINNVLNNPAYSDLEVYSVILDPSGSPTTQQLLDYGANYDSTGPNYNPSNGEGVNTYQATFDDPQDAQDIADVIVAQSCTPPIVCECPDNTYQKVGNCSETETPLCIKGDCECPTASPPYSLVGTCGAGLWPTCERQICSCEGTPGYGTNMNWETGVCNDQSNPLICNYDFSDSIPPNYDIAGIWRHNARTDKFANFYDVDYPWEIDLLETSGQTVTTLRSVEYSLESFVYKNDSRDRFHVLDFNFDEAEIYNSEQTSGLLKLDLSPKNNAPLITTYPIINANDINILYSKEEQKYRFNQFWDVTNDRGEFTGVENTIYLTRLNGYIRDLNMANINLLKSSFERKKFRHYYNHVVLRRLVSGDKKMLLRLNNTKLNASSR
tara:strand:- start:36985 stop:44646 length:7662 start_codon:yes stop_codon:yes gene_type:complete